MTDYVVLKEYELPRDADWEDPQYAGAILQVGEMLADGALEPDILARLIDRRVVSPVDKVYAVAEWYEAEAERIREALDAERNRLESLSIDADDGEAQVDRMKASVVRSEERANEYDVCAQNIRAMIGGQ